MDFNDDNYIENLLNITSQEENQYLNYLQNKAENNKDYKNIINQINHDNQSSTDSEEEYVNAFDSDDNISEEENDNQFNILKKNEKDLNNFKILEDFILISSDNRNFNIEFLQTNSQLLNKGRFNYEIKFNPANNNWKKIPIYENNETKPASLKDLKEGRRGVLNIKSEIPNGFTFNGKEYGVYDASKPKGNIIGYEYLHTSGTNGIIIPTIFRNIVEFEIIRVALPREYLKLNFDNISFIERQNIPLITQYPYILLQIDEIESNLNGSSNSITKAFTQLVCDIDEINPDYLYVEYKPLNNKIFYFDDLNILNNLSLKILTPDGNPIPIQNDVFEVTNIVISQTNQLYNNEGSLIVTFNNNYDILQITLQEEYFCYSYYINSVVRLININTNNEEWNKFLNRIEGHRVLGHSNTQIGSFLKTTTIYIQNKYELDGNVNEENRNLNFTLLNDPIPIHSSSTILNNDIINSNEENICELYKPLLINKTLQNNLSLKIKTKILDNRINFKNKIK